MKKAIRDLLLEGTHPFEIGDVTGAPWIEIDFPADIARATHDILPQLLPQSPPPRREHSDECKRSFVRPAVAHRATAGRC